MTESRRLRWVQDKAVVARFGTVNSLDKNQLVDAFLLILVGYSEVSSRVLHQNVQSP